MESMDSSQGPADGTLCPVSTPGVKLSSWRLPLYLWFCQSEWDPWQESTPVLSTPPSPPSPPPEDLTLFTLPWQLSEPVSLTHLFLFIFVWPVSLSGLPLLTPPGGMGYRVWVTVQPTHATSHRTLWAAPGT